MSGSHFIRDDAGDVASVTVLELGDDSLFEQLQEWGGLVGQILGFDVQVGETKILWLPWGIIEDKEGLQCYILGLNIFQASFLWHGLIPHWSMTEWHSFLHVSSCSSMYKAFSVFSRKGLQQLTRTFHTHLTTVPDASPDVVFIFVDGMNLHLIYTIMAFDCSSFYFPVQLIQHLRFLWGRRDSLRFMYRLFISTYTVSRPSYVMRATLCFKNCERYSTSTFVLCGVIVSDSWADVASCILLCLLL